MRGFMNKYYLMGIPLFFASIILMGYDILLGNGKILLIIFIPVLYGNSVYFMLGVICFMISIFLIMTGSVIKFILSPERVEQKNAYQPQQPLKKTKIGGGGIVFVGPIPLIIGSDKRTLVFLAIVVLVLMFAMLFLTLFFYNPR
jgi:uncharacterized protein (TIGR00304 family)